MAFLRIAEMGLSNATPTWAARFRRRALHKKEAWRLAAGGAEEKFVDEEASKARRVVADQAVFFEEIVEHKLDLALENLLGINEDGLGALGAITARDVGGDGLAIGDNPVNHTLADVILDGAQMLTESVVRGFARLGHDMADIDPQGPGLP